MELYIGIGIIIIISLFIFIVYNSLVKLNNRVKEAFATMDVYLKKRWDLIPNIVDIVKGYASHEKQTLEDIIKLRNNSYDNMSNEEKLKTNKQLNMDISRIMVLAESYPELKANANFLDLSNQLKIIEDDIANSRKYYNAVIRLFNNKVEMFPSNIIAKIFGFKSKDMFEITESERENINIDI